MRAGDQFPPVMVFFDGRPRFIVADGFHRHAAAKIAGLKTLPCEIRPGGFREAQLFACGGNAKHGLKRSRGTKRGLSGRS